VSYLLDTNVVSELRRKTPNPGVLAWMQNRPSSTLFLSVLTLGELRKGIEGLADEQRRLNLADWLESHLPIFFTGRILPIDAHVSDLWGRMVARAGRPLPAVDSLIAATASLHDLVLVTRNVRDFEGLGVPLINPWA
jgi:predicted nucleic acid-binding protein